MRDEDTGGNIHWSSDPPPPTRTPASTGGDRKIFSGPVEARPFVRARRLEGQEGSLINRGPEAPPREVPAEKSEPDHAANFGAHRRMINKGTAPDWTEALPKKTTAAGPLPHMTGIVRGLDATGRVVLPKEMLLLLEINPGDQVEILTSKDLFGRPILCVQKFQQGCVLCGAAYTGTEEMVNNRPVCVSCMTTFRRLTTSPDPSPSPEDV